MFFNKNHNQMILIGVLANRNWVLGNLIKEIHQRLPKSTKLWWVLSVFAQKSIFENFLDFGLPKRKAYFFSYLTIFERNFMKKPQQFFENSIILYTHDDPELGSLKHQALVLNASYATYFMCSSDARLLVSNGLNISKVRLCYFGIDTECTPEAYVPRDKKVIVLASKFGPRKGLEKLPYIIDRLPDWNFVALGRGWEAYILKQNLAEKQNFEYHEFNKENRQNYFTKAKIFLSLSIKEGGPVPLIEAMYLGATPVSTSVGFAPDLIKNNVNGILLDVEPSAEDVVAAIIKAERLNSNPSKSVEFLTWDRFARMVETDRKAILMKKTANIRSRGSD